jgi:hypothetical protein
MTTRTRLSEAEARRDDIRREIDELEHVKKGSANSALGELETALMSELGAVEDKIQKIAKYLDSRTDADD